jgi:hypothetical protein
LPRHVKQKRSDMNGVSFEVQSVQIPGSQLVGAKTRTRHRYRDCSD